MLILQIGCSGTYNYGDEMSHRSVRIELRRIFPEARIIQLGSNFKMLELEHSDADEVVSFSMMDRITELAREADFWVYGPGTVMTPGPSISVAGIIFEINKNVVIWGVGAASFVGHEDSTGAEMIRSTKLATARDLQSAEFMRHIRSEVHVVPDPMLIHVLESRMRYKPGGKNAVTISSKILGRGGWLTDELEDSVLKSVAGAMTEIGGEWYALPASWIGGSYDSDVICHQKLADLVPGLILLEPENFDDVTSLICDFDFYISSRLHTGVPAAGLGVKTVFFGDDKTRFMTENWGLAEIFAGHYRAVSTDSIMQSAKHAENAFGNGGISNLVENFEQGNSIFDSLRTIFG